MTATPDQPKKIVIYSVGLLGGSIGLALKSSGYTGTISGLSSPSAITTALGMGCIDEGFGYDALEEVIADADVCILCSPIHAIVNTLKKMHSFSLPENLLITDVGSTKKIITAAADAVLPRHVHFLGGHPMAGSEKSGPAAADPYLFENAVWAFTPHDAQPSEIHRGFASFIESHMGCRHVFLDPSTHDTIAAAVSHVPHIIAVALVNIAAEIEQSTPGTLSFAAGGFRDVTRIASAPFSMWGDILDTNKSAIAPILKRYIAHLETLHSLLCDQSLQEHFDAAVGTRKMIPSHKKGFISPLHEIVVVGEDKPSTLAGITHSLAEQKINIRDMEVMKVREGEGGTIKLGFNSYETAQNAVKVLSQSGFSARERK